MISSVENSTAQINLDEHCYSNWSQFSYEIFVSDKLIKQEKGYAQAKQKCLDNYQRNGDINRCTFTDSHQVFIEQMDRAIGNRHGEDSLSRDRPILGQDGYISVTNLKSGNQEHAYNVISKHCYVYLEVNPETNIVVDWRFEAPNPHKDCYINQ